MADTSGVGRMISGRYRLVADLGSGGFGRVWKAHDEALNVDVAIKEVWLPPASSPQEQAERLARAEREARNAAKLRDHPDIVAVYDVVLEDGAPWIVMQLVDGASLEHNLATQGPLSVDQTAQVAMALLRALAAADQAGIVHRDVKPGNVLITTDGHVLLTDFGIAVHREDTALTASGMVIGSAEYMAPERAHQDATVTSDLFSLGVTLYQAVEGSSPFRRESLAATVAAVLSVPAPSPKRAGRLEPLITRLLDKQPDHRPTIPQALALAATPPQDRSAEAGHGQQQPPVPASTRILGEAERPVAESAGGHPPPQPLHPQPLYPQAPDPQRPASSSGVAILAMILCTVSSLCLVGSAISVVIGSPPILVDVPPGVSALDNGVWTIGDILVIVGTILMWGRTPAGRILAIIGLGMVLASMLGIELVALSRPYDNTVVRPWTYPINVFTVLSLAFALLPDTGRHVKAGPSSPYAPVWPPPPGHSPEQ